MNMCGWAPRPFHNLHQIIAKKLRGPRSAGNFGVVPHVAQQRGSMPQCALRSARETSGARNDRSEEHTSELQSLMRISYAVICLNKKKQDKTTCKILEHDIDKHIETSTT